MFFLQIDKFWFVKYIPSHRRRIEQFKQHVSFADNFAWKKIEERKKSMKDGEECSDFISVYLKEVKTSGGKLQDRQVFANLETYEVVLTILKH